MKKIILLFAFFVSFNASAEITGVITPPAGSNGQVQFNKSNRFGVDSTFSFSTSTHILSLYGLSLTSPLGVASGGTGQNWGSVTVGRIPYFSATGTLSTLAAGTTGYHLISNGAAAPSWAEEAFVNVKDPPYSAVGDGTTDDLTAIRAAVSAVSGDGTGKGVVYLPDGDYGISHSIYLPSGVILRGAGINATTIKVLATMPDGIDAIRVQTSTGAYYMPGNFASYSGVENLTVDFTLNPTGIGAGIMFDATDFGTIDHVRVVRSPGYGIYLGGAQGGQLQQGVTVKYSILDHCGVAGGADSIGGGWSKGSKLLFNRCYGATGTCIDQVGVDDALWEGNTSTGSVSHNGQMWSDFGMTNSRIVNNYIEGGSIHVYGYLGASPLLGAPSNVLIKENILVGAGSSAILVSPANQAASDTRLSYGIKIIDNIIDGTIEEGIVVNDSSGTIISGNTVNNWSTSTSGRAAILLAGGVNTALGSHWSVISSNQGIHNSSSTLFYSEGAGGGQTNRNTIFGNSFPECTVSLDTTQPTSTYVNFIATNAAAGSYGVITFNDTDLVIDNASNMVGVGTKNPAFTLDVNGNAQVALGLTVGGTLNATSPGNNLKAVADTSNASSGYFGEYISSACTTVSFPTSGNFGDNISVLVSSGDWDISFVISANANNATVTNVCAGIGTVTGNDTTGISAGNNYYCSSLNFAGSTSNGISLPAWRSSSSSTVRYYLKVNSTYSVATPNYSARISARRASH